MAYFLFLDADRHQIKLENFIVNLFGSPQVSLNLLKIARIVFRFSEGISPGGQSLE